MLNSFSNKITKQKYFLKIPVRIGIKAPPKKSSIHIIATARRYIGINVNGKAKKTAKQPNPKQIFNAFFES